MIEGACDVKAKISQWAQEVAGVKRAERGESNFFVQENRMRKSLP